MTGAHGLDSAAEAIASPDGNRCELQRLRNLRDLGGLPTRSGEQMVKPRSVFRSSSPAGFAPDERRALAALALRTAVDLRTTVEVVRSGNAPFASDVQVIHRPLFETVRPNWIAPADQSPRATSKRYVEMFEVGRQAIAAVVLRMAGSDAAPLLVSCSAGRDRTGIVVACLLDLLDVAEETIAGDYGQSDAFDSANGRAHPATIVQWLGLVRARYGSVARTLVSSGVTDSVVESLRRELLVARGSETPFAASSGRTTR
jgi:protein-tyrosine phosphatase